MTSKVAVWHGTPTEGFALLAAMAHNCDCQRNTEGHRISICGVHNLLVNDQRWLDRQLFMRHLGPTFIREEWCV